jgi:hypothetical protein
VIALGAAALVLLAIASRGWAVERWWLWKLSSSGRAERARAAGWLASEGSVRALLPALRIVCRTPDAVRCSFMGEVSLDSPLRRTGS